MNKNMLLKPFQLFLLSSSSFLICEQKLNKIEQNLFVFLTIEAICSLEKKENLKKELKYP